MSRLTMKDPQDVQNTLHSQTDDPDKLFSTHGYGIYKSNKSDAF